MNGEEFYQNLINFYHFGNQHINGNKFFSQWLLKYDGTFNFQFTFLNNTKSIPKAWLVDARNASNQGVVINRNWFNLHFGENTFNDCRATVAIWLLDHH